MISGVAMKENVVALTENIGVNSEIWPGCTIGLEGGHEPSVAVVIALHEMKIATRVAADEIVDPAEGVANGVVGRGKRRPTKIENVATEDKRFGLCGGRVDRRLVPRRLRAAGTEVEIRKEIAFHGKNSRNRRSKNQSIATGFLRLVLESLAVMSLERLFL